MKGDIIALIIILFMFFMILFIPLGVINQCKKAFEEIYRT